MCPVLGRFGLSWGSLSLPGERIGLYAAVWGLLDLLLAKTQLTELAQRTEQSTADAASQHLSKSLRPERRARLKMKGKR